MYPIKSKNQKLNLQVRTNLGVKPEEETDLEANSTPLDTEDLGEVAAYGKTRSCPNWG